jgi:hypothetical protein
MKKSIQGNFKPVNIAANNTVAIVPYKAPVLLPCIKEW